MKGMQVGSLNVNGMRDGRKNNVLSELIFTKKLSVVFLQETHSDQSNEVDWDVWWKGEKALSHGTNLSAGVAVLFSPGIKAKIISKKELQPGRCLIVRAEISNLVFLFVNIYAPNIGADRVQLFKKIDFFLKQQQDDDFIVMGGDWNCTLNFTLDRNGEEQHAQSSFCLDSIIKIIFLFRQYH